MADVSKVNFSNPASYDSDMNVVTGLLKTYFRELPEPLLTFHYYDSFIAAQSNPFTLQKMVSKKDSNTHKRTKTNRNRDL